MNEMIDIFKLSLFMRLFLILLYLPSVCPFLVGCSNIVVENGNSFPETKTISTENGSTVEAQDKNVVSEGFGSVVVCEQQIAPPISGHRPKSRHEHGAAVIQEKMYIYGGNHNGRDLKISVSHARISFSQLLDIQRIFLTALRASRGGQSVSIVVRWLGSFGGQDAKITLLNDLHILDLETMAWDEIDAV